MGSFNRNDRGGSRGGYQSRGRSSFGGDRSGSRGGYQPRGQSSFGGGGRGFDRGGDRPMFKTTCSNCGKDCEVPFRPTSGKPVYCSDCFEKMGGRGQDSPRPERSGFRAPAPSFDQNKAQFDVLNVKLEAMSVKIEKILRLLEPKVAPTIVYAPIVEEIKETKVKKVTSEK